jgi:hypothetical protein
MRPIVLTLLGALPLCGAGLRAGVARIEITPREPIWMAGYASRDHASTGVRQPLWARALAIDDGSRERTVIVATDLIGLPAALADQVAARAESQFGIQRAHLILNSSHTHTGLVVWPGLGAMFTLPDGEEVKLRDTPRTWPIAWWPRSARLPAQLVEGCVENPESPSQLPSPPDG